MQITNCVDYSDIRRHRLQLELVARRHSAAAAAACESRSSADEGGSTTRTARLDGSVDPGETVPVPARSGAARSTDGRHGRIAKGNKDLLEFLMGDGQ